MENYLIYNKSSEEMGEIKDESIDVIVFSPPYNIGTIYGDNSDKTEFGIYKEMLKSVIGECHRALRADGKMAIECADSVLSDGLYVQLSGLIQSMCIEAGLTIIERNINFVHSRNGIELVEHSWNEDYTTKENAHSNCHQIVIFSKDKTAQFNESGNMVYFDYISSKDHPCPFSQKFIDFFLNKYFTENKTVLDPFMGTGLLGAEVIRRKGMYFGYEIDKSIFEVAKKNLESAMG
jgi:DNA modification methylase